MGTISLSTRHGRISGWQAKPHVSPKGAVIVVQEIFGVNSHIRQVADRFAHYGYVAIEVDPFDRPRHARNEHEPAEAGVVHHPQLRQRAVGEEERIGGQPRIGREGRAAVAVLRGQRRCFCRKPSVRVIACCAASGT